jgi:hypothetical protein
MCILKPLYITPDSYFYKYYNNYINKQNNSESDVFILNLLKCRSKIIKPIIINKNDITQCFTHSKNDNNEYYDLFKTKINDNKNICNICYEKLDDLYIITSCFHTFCYKCTNTVYFNNKTKSVKANGNHLNKMINKDFKCPCCNYSQTEKDLYLFTNNNLDKHNLEFRTTYLSMIKLMYEIKNNLDYNININKEYIYKYLGYKTYYIIDKIISNKAPFNILKSNKKKKHIIKILISNNPRWIELMTNLCEGHYSLNNFIFCLTGNLMKVLNNHINTTNTEFKYDYNLYLLEPYNKTNYDNIKSNLNLKLLEIQDNIQYANINIIPYQLIIKNTIDETIFKNKVIIT